MGENLSLRERQNENADIHKVQPIFFHYSEIHIKFQSLGKTFDGFFNVSPSEYSSTSTIVTSPPLDHFDTLPLEGPFVSPLPPSFQYKHNHKNDFTNHSSSKCCCLACSVSQAISSSQLTSPFTELKQKRENVIFDSLRSKRPNLGLPPLPEPSAQPSSTQYRPPLIQTLFSYSLALPGHCLEPVDQPI